MLTHIAHPHPATSIEYRIHAALLRQGLVLVPLNLDNGLAADAPMGPQLAAALHSQLTLESLGFVYSKELLRALSWLPTHQLATAHDNLYAMLTRSLGAHQVFQPMYPNFPEQVLEASDCELLTNAFMHYLGDWFGLRILPAYTAHKRLPLLEKLMGTRKPTVLRLGASIDLAVMLGRLIDGNASLSPTNRALVLDLLTFFSNNDAARLIQMLKYSATIPQKETRALVGGWLRRYAPQIFGDANFHRFFTTPTDVLRLALAICERDLAAADLTLTAAPRFARMSRGHRRLLLSLLNDIHSPSALEEVNRRREQWLRLGECLHPREHAQRFERANELFQALRDKKVPRSWAGDVEVAIADGRALVAAHLLSARPGVFARKLHEVLRKAGISAMMPTAEAFAKVAHQVSTPVLLQLRHRVSQDIEQVAGQAFAPKAGAGRIWVPRGETPHLPPPVANFIVNTVNATLFDRFAKLPALGKVYVDPALSGFTVPFAQRTAQKTLKTVGRGSRVPLGNDRVLRAFMWWNEKGTDKNGQPMAVGRTDLDLSCAVLDADYNYVTHCSFTHLREEGLTHSGDITSAPKGACEFIDIDFSKLPGNARYIALLAYAYTRQNFGDLPEAYLGWMSRADGQSGEIYDARTVRQKVDLTATGQRVLVGYIDVQTREFVWADLVLPARCSGFNAVETSTDLITRMARGILQPIRPSLGTLLALHAAARGTPVCTPEEADVVFAATPPTADHLLLRPGQKGITAFDAEIIAAEFLQ